MKHKHHIIPKHAGGTDNLENLIELSIEEHAEAHRVLFEQHGRWQDRLAWMGLAKMINREEIIKQMLHEAGKKAHTVPRKSRKGMKLDNGGNRNPAGTKGTRWYYNPDNMTKRGCFMENEQPDGWKLGQGKKLVNPGLNFHSKKLNKESAI